MSSINFSDLGKRARIWDDSDDSAPPDPDRKFLNGLPAKRRARLESEEKRLEKQLDSEVPLRFKILELEAPDNVKIQALKMLTSYENDSENAAGFRAAIETICELPWNCYHQPGASATKQSSLESAYQIMNQTIYGQERAKWEILEFLASQRRNPKSNRVIGLHGAPGTGKTTLIKHTLSAALQDRPFYYISLGGASDVTTLVGSRPVWKGARMGRLAEALVQCKCFNPIIYFDELDKISRDKGDEIYDFLIHLTDPVQNGHIYDLFLGIELDLSQALFVFSYNDRSLIKEVLLDRLREIQMDAFDATDKVEIAEKYVIPRLLEEYQLQDQVVVPRETIEWLNQLSGESLGARSLIKVYQTLFSRLLVSLELQKQPAPSLSKFPVISIKKFPLKLTVAQVRSLLPTE